MAKMNSFGSISDFMQIIPIIHFNFRVALSIGTFPDRVRENPYKLFSKRICREQRAP